MSRATSEPVSSYFEGLHRNHGVRFRFGASISEIIATPGGLAAVERSGEVHPADAVIVGVGVVPNQDLGVDAGLDHDDGILVDDDARTSDPHIYAIGDATRFTCPREGVSLRLECVQNAITQAEAAARHISGAPCLAPEIPWFWTVQHGVRLQTAGVREENDEMVVRGDVERGKFSVLHFRDGRLAAIDTVNSLRDFTAGKKHIAARAVLDVSVAADDSISLAEAAAVMTR